MQRSSKSSKPANRHLKWSGLFFIPYRVGSASRETAFTLGAAAAALWILAGIAVGAETSIAFKTIQGTKRRDLRAGTWELAWGGPMQLFRDGRSVLVLDTDAVLVPGAGPRPLVAVRDIRRGISFTCLIQLVESRGGILDVNFTAADGSILSRGATSFGEDGWVALTFEIEGHAPAKSVLRLHAKASGPTKVRRIVLYRSFDQLFFRDSPYPLRGMVFRKFGTRDELSSSLNPGTDRDYTTKLWRTYPKGLEDGIEVADLIQNHLALLCTKKGTLSGVSMPIGVMGGCRLCRRGKERFTLTMLIDGSHEQPLPPGYRHRWQSIGLGDPAEWSADEVALDPAFLDADGNGVWSGYFMYSWHESNVLVQNYGKGKLDYLVFLPQNRIALPAAPDRGRLSLTYRTGKGDWRLIELDIPPAAVALGLVYEKPHVTQLFWQTDRGWLPTEQVTDSFGPNFLAVRANGLTVH